MKIIKSILLIAALVCSGMAYSQKIKLVSGNLSFLKGQKEIKITYNYDNMKVGKISETTYINKKVADYNNDEKGKGDKWKESWFNDREKKFQPKFAKLFNKYLEDKGVRGSQESNEAKYNMLVKTTMTDPGFNIGIGKKPALVSFEIIFTAISDADKILAKITIINVKGQSVTAIGGDITTGIRIQEAYAKCGKALGAYLAKTAFK